MKCFATIALLACVAVLTHAEPPVPQSQYLPPNQQAQQPSNNYLPPTQSYQTPSSNYLPPQRSQQQPLQQPTATYGAPQPSNSYGAPAVTGAIFPKPQGGGGQNGYGGQQGGGYGGGGNNGYGNRAEENYGPAKYEFKYDVQDYESGNDFGHMESRDGDYTVGRYYVLLPDGRKQVVDYEADQNGYRPTITYEQTQNGGGAGAGARGGQYGGGQHGGGQHGGAGGAGGYDSNAQSNKFGGYQ